MFHENIFHGTFCGNVAKIVPNVAADFAQTAADIFLNFAENKSS